MVFRITQSPTYEWPVKFRAPAETGGTVETHEIMMRFKRLGRQRLQDLEKVLRGEAEKLPYEVLPEVVTGWSDVVDAAGEPVPFTQAALRQLLNDCPLLAGAIVDAMLGSWNLAAEKNSAS